MSLPEQVAAGRRPALEALRDRLAEELVTAFGRDVAPIARELRATLADLEAIPGGREESPVDDLAARRKARRDKAAGQ
jgi:hypothetical protein